MKVKKAFNWERNFSAGGPVLIPSGAPVETQQKQGKTYYYVVPSYFSGILEHDATYYGCRVDPENVEE